MYRNFGTKNKSLRKTRNFLNLEIEQKVYIIRKSSLVCGVKGHHTDMFGNMIKRLRIWVNSNTTFEYKCVAVPTLKAFTINSQTFLSMRGFFVFDSIRARNWNGNRYSRHELAVAIKYYVCLHPSSIQDPASSSHVELPVWSIQHGASTIQLQHPTFSIQLPASNFQHPIFSIQLSVSLMLFSCLPGIFNEITMYPYTPRT